MCTSKQTQIGNNLERQKRKKARVCVVSLSGHFLFPSLSPALTLTHIHTHTLLRTNAKRLSAITNFYVEKTIEW